MQQWLTLSPFPGPRVDIIRIEALWFLQVLQHLPNVLHFAFEDQIAGDVAEMNLGFDLSISIFWKFLIIVNSTVFDDSD